MTDYELSVIIPSRNEEFLNRTIQDVLEHKKAKTQIIVGLDGQWPVEPIQQHPDVVILFFPESIGQRAISNQCVNISRAKFIMKCDAHVAFDDGFDQKMIDAFKETGDNVIMAPVMRNLHVFDWVCKEGHRRYQGPSGPCKECNGETHKEIMWIPKTNPQSVAYCFDSEPHFQYMNELKNRTSYKEQGDLTESMSLQGSCFMLTREKYWELGVCDEDMGSWGSQGVELACKFWLSGGRVLINHRSWYGHCFRTQGGTFGFPYPISGKQVEHAKKFAKDLFFENKWPKQVNSLSWLIEKFFPVRGWSEEELARIKRFDLPSNLGTLKTSPSASNGVSGTENMSPKTELFNEVKSGGSSSPHNILSGQNQDKVGGITTDTVITEVVKNLDIFPVSTGNGTNEPSIHKTMNVDSPVVVTGVSVPTVIETASPIPATSNPIKDNFIENLGGFVGTDIIDSKHNTSIPRFTEPSKGVIYYTDNLLDEKVMKACQHQLWKAATRDHKLPIVSVSLKPMDFGKNIVFDGIRGYLTMTKQILTALEALETDIVYFTEHDCLYHPSHFDFIPPDRNTWYYDSNYWFLRQLDGFAISYDCSPLSGLVVYRDIAIKHFKERIELMEKDQFKTMSMLQIGFEPMTHGRIPWINKYPFKTFSSSSPSIDITHGSNVSRKRWSIDLFRRKPKFWKEGTIDTIENWDNVRKLLNREGVKI